MSLNEPEAYKMKNGTWPITGISDETGITVYKIVGKKEPEIPKSNHWSFKKLFHR